MSYVEYYSLLCEISQLIDRLNKRELLFLICERRVASGAGHSEKTLNYYLVRLDNFLAGEVWGHYSDSSKKLETTSTL